MTPTVRHTAPAPRLKRALLLAVSATALAACQPLDMDLRGGFGSGKNGATLTTADAARNAVADRPKPDARGVISYPNYQVAVARRGDTLQSLATRVGANPEELARYNGIQTGDPLNAGEVVALPSRVAEPAGGPIQAPGVDVTALAGSAIDRAEAQQVQTSTLAPAQTGVEPIRHQVQRGETAYTIARLYNVSVRSLAEWNGLGKDFAVREGQYLLIPVILSDDSAAGEPLDATGGVISAPATPVVTESTTPEPVIEEPAVEQTAATEPPGSFTPAPAPPSASTPLPEEETTPVAKQEPTPAAETPDIGQEKAAAAANSGGKLAYPVTGAIVREYSKGKNDGIDIAASAGTSVKSAGSGTVAAITKDTNGVPIIVVKHDDGLLTVYSNVDGVSVEKGQSIARGQSLAKARADGSAVHFEVRKGFDSVDPMPYLDN